MCVWPFYDFFYIEQSNLSWYFNNSPKYCRCIRIYVDVLVLFHRTVSFPCKPSERITRAFPKSDFIAFSTGFVPYSLFLNTRKAKLSALCKFLLYCHMNSRWWQCICVQSCPFCADVCVTIEHVCASQIQFQCVYVFMYAWHPFCRPYTSIVLLWSCYHIFTFSKP